MLSAPLLCEFTQRKVSNESCLAVMPLTRRSLFFRGDFTCVAQRRFPCAYAVSRPVMIHRHRTRHNTKSAARLLIPVLNAKARRRNSISNLCVTKWRQFIPEIIPSELKDTTICSCVRDSLANYECARLKSRIGPAYNSPNILTDRLVPSDFIRNRYYIDTSPLTGCGKTLSRPTSRPRRLNSLRKSVHSPDLRG